MENCELCAVLQKENYRIVLSSVHSFICLNHEPLSEAHLLILPKRHILKPQELTPDEAKDILSLLEHLSEKLPSHFNMKGAMSFLNHGAHRTQQHLHFHFLPLHEGLRYLVAPYLNVDLRKKRSKEELVRLTLELKRKLELQ